MRRGKQAAAILALVLLCGPGPVRAHDYPTPALADYVFGCMASNGQTRDSLERCSCSIDVIASVIPYERYVQAETIMRLRQVRGGGDKMAGLHGIQRPANPSCAR